MATSQFLQDGTSNQPEENKKILGLLPKYIFRRIVIIFTIVVILLVTSLLFYKLFHWNVSQNTSPNYPQLSSVQSTVNPDTIIEKVGKEDIFQNELDTELYYYPPAKPADVRKILLQKMANDSITLQAAAAEKLITLDDSVFNSPTIMYGKRIQLVARVEEMINERQESVSGNVVSIWFFDNAPGAVGYVKGQEIALNTITPLYNQVKSGKMTIQQAAQAIQADSILSQVDTAYKNNAIFNFTAGPTDMITFDQTFNAMIHTLNPGQVTPLYLAQEINYRTKKKVNAVYMFAQVNKKVSSGQPDNYEQWFAQKEKAYEITIY